jgi:hypothetical protein
MYEFKFFNKLYIIFVRSRVFYHFTHKHTHILYLIIYTIISKNIYNC